MSVYCREDDFSLFVKDEAFCVTTRESGKFSTVCGSHIAATIALYERFPEPVDGGLDIHFLFGQPNGFASNPIEDTMSYSRGLVFGEYRFSIGPLTARLVLPKTCQLYLD